MSLSPDAAELVSQIKELRAEQQRQFQSDLAIIDAAYDRNVRRAERTIPPRTSHNPFPLLRAYSLRLRHCRRAKRISRHRHGRYY
jgi:hypothetical protein